MDIAYKDGRFNFYKSPGEDLVAVKAIDDLLAGLRPLVGEDGKKRSISCTPETEVAVKKFAEKYGVSIRLADTHATAWIYSKRLSTPEDTNWAKIHVLLRTLYPISKIIEQCRDFMNGAKKANPEFEYYAWIRYFKGAGNDKSEIRSERIFSDAKTQTRNTGLSS